MLVIQVAQLPPKYCLRFLVLKEEIWLEKMLMSDKDVLLNGLCVLDCGKGCPFPQSGVFRRTN